MNLFQGIPDEVIEKTLENIGKNLHKIDLYHGHTINKHVDVQLAILKSRLTYENIKFATSFEDMKTAYHSVFSIIKYNFETKVKEWLLLVNPDALTLYGTFRNPVGYGYKVNDKTLYETLNEVCLVLVKDYKLDFGFRILTGYPIF